MLTFSTENTPSLEPKSPTGSFACSTTRLLYYSLALLFYCSPVSFGLLYYLLSTHFSAVADECAHKTIPFLQNKANFRRADNDRNLSSNKHLRTQTTPGSAKKQSQFKTNWQKGRDPCQTSPNTSYQFRGTLLRAYKAPLAGVPLLQATRAHKTIPFMQNKANFRRAANDCNLSSNKHLRTQITPGGAKKTKPIPTKAKNQYKPILLDTLADAAYTLMSSSGVGPRSI